MHYHYDHETKEFLFESHEMIKDFPSTEIDINFKLPANRSQIFDGEKWQVVYDYRKEIVFKKNSLNRIYKKLGQKIEEDEVIYKSESEIKIPINETENKKTNIKLKINGFLSSTDKYFINHPPKYKDDIEKLKKYREYLYSFTEKEKWWEFELIEFDKWI